MPILKVKGDSISAGTVGGAANAWPALLAAKRGLTLANGAVSGAMAGDQAFAGRDTLANPADIHGIMLGTNDERIYQADAVRKTFWSKCMLANILQFALPTRVFPRTWAGMFGNTQVTSGGRSSNVLGQKLTSPADVISGDVLYVWALVQNASNAGGVTIVRVDGVQVATIDTTGIGAQTANGLAWPMACFRIPLPTGGSHQVEFEQGSAGKMQYIECIAGNGQPDLPEVYVSNIIRSNGYTSGGSDAIVSDYNATLAALIDDLYSDGLLVGLVDCRAVINPATDLADAYHPTSAGQIKLRDAFDAAMTAGIGGGTGDPDPPADTEQVFEVLGGGTITHTYDGATGKVKVFTFEKDAA